MIVKSIRELQKRVKEVDKRINKITAEFGDMIELLALWNNAYHSKDDHMMEEVAGRTSRILQKMRDTYG